MFRPQNEQVLHPASKKKKLHMNAKNSGGFGGDSLFHRRSFWPALIGYDCTSALSKIASILTYPIVKPYDTYRIFMEHM